MFAKKLSGVVGAIALPLHALGDVVLSSLRLQAAIGYFYPDQNAGQAFRHLSNPVACPACSEPACV